MVDLIHGPGNAGGPQQVDPTTGTGGPQGGPGGPRMSNAPAPVEQNMRLWAAPPCPPPELDLKTLNERYTNIRVSLETGEVQDMSTIMQQIEELQHALDQQQLSTQKTEIESGKSKIDSNLNEQLKKISEASEKMKAQQTWGIFTKIFTVAAAALALVGSIATAVASGGITLPAVLAVGAASIGAIVAVLQTTGLDKTIFDALKVSDSARMWIMLGISAAIFVMNLPSIVQGVKTAVQLASGVVNSLSKGVQGALTTASTSQKLAMAASLGGGLSTMGQGTTKIGESVATFEGAGIEHDRKRLETRNMQLRQMMDDLMDDLKELMEKMEEGVRGTAEVVQQQASSMQYLTRTGV